jgi:hypothetical protein
MPELPESSLTQGVLRPCEWCRQYFWCGVTVGFVVGIVGMVVFAELVFR